MKIVSGGLAGEEVYFDEVNPDGIYTVDLDRKGTYRALFYAKYHVGSVEIVAADEKE